MLREDEIGCKNISADDVMREDVTWSYTNFDGHFDKSNVFLRLKCRECGGITFEVLKTRQDETTSKCLGCGMYYKVHRG